MKKYSLLMMTALLVSLCWTVNAEEISMGVPSEKMAEMKALMTPGEAHEVLMAFEGSWDYTGFFWMTPNAEPQLMEGNVESELIFNGRFLQQEISGPWMGQDFEGLGFTGYDNLRKEYISIWLDNMATGIMNVSGQYSPETKTLNLSGQFSCAMTGETHRSSRSEWKIIDDETNVYTSYMSSPDGGEYKVMEMTYTRA